MLDTDEQRDMYRRLWTMSDEADPPVRVLYEIDEFMPLPGLAAVFCESMDDGDGPGIRVRRDSCPPEPWEPDVDGATLGELISLAHERGHEHSFRAGTYHAMSMAEEDRAWTNAEVLLRSLGFEEWDAFTEAKKNSLEVHRQRGTPE